MVLAILFVLVVFETADRRARVAIVAFLAIKEGSNAIVELSVQLMSRHMRCNFVIRRRSNGSLLLRRRPPQQHPPQQQPKI